MRRPPVYRRLVPHPDLWTPLLLQLLTVSVGADSAKTNTIARGANLTSGIIVLFTSLVMTVDERCSD